SLRAWDFREGISKKRREIEEATRNSPQPPLPPFLRASKVFSRPREQPGAFEKPRRHPAGARGIPIALQRDADQFDMVLAIGISRFEILERRLSPCLRGGCFSVTEPLDSSG